MAKKSFWSGAPGIIACVAGLLSATAALVGLLVTFGVIGGKDSAGKDVSGNGNGSMTEQTTGGSTQTTAAVTPTFTVDPTTVTLDQLLAKESKVVVKNTGDVPLSVQSPVLRGGDAAQFAATDVSCTDAKIPAGDTCEMKVTFTPKANGRYSATLVISASGTSKSAEVSLRGSAIL